MPDWWICASLLVTLCIIFKDVNIKRFRLVLQIWDNLSTASSTSFDFFHVCVHILLQKHACRWQLLAYILAYSDKSDLQPILFSTSKYLRIVLVRIAVICLLSPLLVYSFHLQIEQWHSHLSGQQPRVVGWC